MNQPRLNVEIVLPHAWRLLDDPVDAFMARGNHLLLHTLNAIESATLEASPDRAHERLEAKLDLALHWLGRVLHAGKSVPEARALRLDGEGMAWIEADAPPSGSRLCVTLYPSTLMAAPLELEMRVEGSDGPWLRARLMDDNEEFVDAWTQWLFRLHRRTIQAARR